MKRKRFKLAEIPYRIEGNNIIIEGKKYTFTSLAILTGAAMYMSLAAIAVGFLNLFIRGFGVSVLYILAGFVLLGFSSVYNKILKSARMKTGRRSLLGRLIRRDI